MKNFEYAQPRTESEVLDLLSPEPGKTALLAGGTDLVGLMKRMVVNPDRVVNIADVDSFGQIEQTADGGVVVGAAVCLDEFLTSSLTDSYPAVKQAIQGINSIQLQSQGTLVGELCRRPTCWYYRGGHGLLAGRGRMVAEGDNRYHAILGNRGPAKFVNASRLAPALIALRAEVRVIGPHESDEKWIPLETLYQVPTNDDQRENVLLPDQLISHVAIPADNGFLSASYEVRHGEGPDAPLASAAASIEVSAGLVRQACIVMGQVAPIPWISEEASRSLANQPITEQTAEIAGVEAVSSAIALSHNEYKIQLAQVAVKRAILRAAGLDTGGF